MNFTSVLRGTSLRWCLRRNSFPSYETAALTWTGFPKSELCKMGRHWTRHPTPSMRHSSLPNTSMDGFLFVPPILTPNMRSPVSATSLRSYANAWKMNPLRSPLHLGLAKRVLLHSPRLSKEHFWGTQHLQPLRPLIQRVYSPFQPRRTHGWKKTCLLAWLIEPLQSGSRISNCRTLKRPSSRRTLSRWKPGGLNNLLKPLKQSKKWL